LRCMVSLSGGVRRTSVGNEHHTTQRARLTPEIDVATRGEACGLGCHSPILAEPERVS